MGEQIVLYDIPSKYRGDDHLTSWSLNPWKSRMVLNFKQIPYETQWVEFGDVEAALKPTGVPPNEPGTSSAPYSCPAIRFTDGKVVQNSINIVGDLEALYPSPSLQLEASPHVAAGKAVWAVVEKLWWDSLPRMGDAIMLPRSAEYFRRTREKSFGATFEELSATRGGQKAWEAAEAPGGPIEQLRDVLVRYKKDDGPFILGSRPCYADFVVVGFLECWKRSSHCTGSGVYERLLQYDEVFGKLHQACQPWLEKDD